MKVHEGGGAEAEQENTEVLEINTEEAMAMIQSGGMKAGKTIMFLQDVKLHHVL